MRHVSITCKNHPHLRWSCKEIAWTNGYNGSRRIIFLGRVKLDPEGIPILYHDKSGTSCEQVTYNGDLIEECSCSAKDLIKSPEDEVIEKAYQAKTKE